MARPQRRDPRRSLDRRRRGGAVHRPSRRRARQGSRRQGGPRRRRPADHGADAGQSRGLPLEVFDGFRAARLANRAQFFRDLPAGPFYGFNRPGATVSPGIVDNWWRQGMMCGIKAAYDCIKAFSETDFTHDLEKIDVPTLIMHGDDDRVVPIGASARLSSKLVRKAQLKVYPGFDPGMGTTVPAPGASVVRSTGGRTLLGGEPT